MPSANKDLEYFHDPYDHFLRLRRFNVAPELMRTVLKEL